MFRPSAYNISWSWACSIKQWITSAIDLLDFLDCKLGNGFWYKKTSVSGETSQNNFLESKSILLPSCWPIFDGHIYSSTGLTMIAQQLFKISRLHEKRSQFVCSVMLQRWTPHRNISFHTGKVGEVMDGVLMRWWIEHVTCLVHTANRPTGPVCSTLQSIGAYVS